MGKEIFKFKKIGLKIILSSGSLIINKRFIISDLK
jgi:hypothetical protein